MLHRSLRLFLAAAALLAAPRPAGAYAFISNYGCDPGRGAAWQMVNGPARWWLHQDGYSRLPFDTVRAVLIASMDAWAAPCCSNFQHAYQGTTTASAQGTSNQHIVEFEEDAWPGELGNVNVTIAVTLPQPTWGCTIIGADMVFNAVGFEFRHGGYVDLQSIATHEFGHWLGLDHTDAPGGTMRPYYSGGTEERTLTQDDENGVCALYPKTCTGCTSDGDCLLGERCDTATGICSPKACASNGDCPTGTWCGGGTCQPGCRSDAECGGSEICRDGACTPDLNAPCSICRSCNRDSECGGGEAMCLNLGQGGVCTRFCAAQSECPGDSRCEFFDDGSGGVIGLCIAPTANANSLCPSDYTCQPLGDGCPGLGGACITNGSCKGGACARGDQGRFCSCTCAADEDCGDGAKCLPNATFGNVCVPEHMIDPCDLVECAEGLVCAAGVCVDPCEGVACGEAERCEAGACVSVCGTCPAGTACDPATAQCVEKDPCEGMICPAGERCTVAGGGASCVPEADPCAGVVCGAGERCEGGACVPDEGGLACGETRCGAGERCHEGRCVARTSCEGITCATGYACVEGNCVSRTSCAGVTCADGFTCVEGACRKREGGGGSKGSGCSASSGASSLLGIALVAELMQRRRESRRTGS